MLVTDALAVSIGLDPSAFRKGMGEVDTSLRKTREGAVKEGRQIEKSLDGAAEAVDRLARNALKLFAIFTAGRAVKEFVSDITAADAAMGRLAKSIGSTPEAISSLANAVARNGGSATAAAGSFERLSDSINELKTTGNSSILPVFARLQGISGRQIRLNTDLATTFGDIADAAKASADKIGISQTSYLLKQAGYDQGTIALLIQGRAKLNEALEKSRKIGIVNEKDTKAAQSLQSSIESLRQTSESFGRSILTTLTPTITELLERFQRWIEANQEWIRTGIVDAVKQFATWVKGINWDDVGTGLRNFGESAKKVADAFGGILKICEALFLFWVGSKAIAIVRSILGVAGLLSAGPLGWAIRLAMAASVGSDVGVPNAEKPGVITRSDDENSGAAVGPSGATGDGGVARDRGRLRGWIGRQYNRARRWLGVGGASDEAGGSAGGNEAPSGPVRPLGRIARNENAQTIIATLKAAGYNDNAIAAVVGSMQTESTFNPRARNNITGGHTGLWQWDRNRWPRIRDWITSQGGDPYSAEWQTKAWIAEHNAKPGDAIYDNRNTERGGRRLRNNPSLNDAITGVRESERFGVGEEGGRANNARRWLPHVNGGNTATPTSAPASAPTSAPTSATSPAPASAAPAGNRADNVSLRMRREMQAGDLGDLSDLDVGGRGYSEHDRQPRDERAPDAQFDINHARQSQRNSYDVMNDRSTFNGRSYAELMETGEALTRRWRGEHGEKSEFEPERELTLDEIRKFAGPRRNAASGNVTGNINATTPASEWLQKMSGIPKAPMSTLGLASAAQAAGIRTSNDNRSTTDNSSQWHIENLNLQTAATDGRAAAHDLRDTLSSRAFAAAANRGLA